MAEHGRPERRAPYREVLSQYARDERRRLRREFRAALEVRAAEAVRKGRARRLRHARREPFLRCGVRVLAALPLPLVAWIGDRAGGLAYRLSPPLRHRVLFHLRFAFGPEPTDDELIAIARETFRLMARGVLSLPRLHRLGPAHLHENLLRVEGTEHLDAALDGGKGAIVIGYHFGLFEVAGSWLGTHRRGAAVGRDTGDVGATRRLIDLRAGLGCPTIERGDARAVVRILRENRPVAIVADHDVVRLNGVFVPFFGQPAHTPLGPAALSARTGAPLVPVTTVWTSRTRHEVRFHAPLRAREDLEKAQAHYELTYRFTKLLEDEIRARPAHWLWVHKRWATTPLTRPELPRWEPPGGV